MKNCLKDWSQSRCLASNHSISFQESLEEMKALKLKPTSCRSFHSMPSIDSVLELLFFGCPGFVVWFLCVIPKLVVIGDGCFVVWVCLCSCVMFWKQQNLVDLREIFFRYRVRGKKKALKWPFDWSVSGCFFLTAHFQLFFFLVFFF